MPVLLSDAPASAERLRLTVGDDVVAIDHERHLDQALTEQHDDLIVIGEDVPLEVATAVAERYRLSRPELGVVLVRRRLEVGTLAAALRAGVREVVATDDTAALVAACRRSREISDRMRGERGIEPETLGQIIIVFSAKGGCGKTTVSTNLAAAIAAIGRSVAVVDFDLQFGDIAVALQLEPSRTIGDAIGMGGGLDEQGIASLLVEGPDGMHCLLAPTNPADAEYIDAELAASVVSLLQRTHDYVIVDSPPAFTEVVLRTFDQADHYLLLTTPDLPAVKNLKVTMDTLDALGMPRSKWQVIVNRADAGAGLPISDVERAIDMEVAHRIPASNAVPAAINKGVTVVASNPRHAVSKAIGAIALSVGAERRKERSGAALPFLRRQR